MGDIESTSGQPLGSAGFNVCSIWMNRDVHIHQSSQDRSYPIEISVTASKLLLIFGIYQRQAMFLSVCKFRLATTL